MNIAVSFSVILAIVIGANYYLSLEFSNQYYNDKLRETDEKYANVSQELLNKIAQLEEELLLIEERDKELRTYAAIPPIKPPPPTAIYIDEGTFSHCLSISSHATSQRNFI